MPGFRIVRLLVISLFVGSMSARAQSSGAGASQNAATATPEPTWSLRVSAATYFVPDDENYLQPTVTADRGPLHLESRYHYEDRQSISAFAGWNLEFGKTVKLALTPMLGAVVGRTDGIIPALEMDLTWLRLELYSEGEYVIDRGDRSNRFLYIWSELSVWATEWLRAGMVTQSTHVFRTSRDIQRGFLVGATASKVEGAFYLFHPGSHDQFIVVSIGARF